MKISNINDWLVLTANFGVILSIIFLGFEVRQNTKAMDREAMVTRASLQTGLIASSPDLPRIMTEVRKIQGGNPTVDELMDTLNLSHEDAERWWRYLIQGFRINEATWIYLGRDKSNCLGSRGLVAGIDSKIVFESLRGTMDQGYIECLDTHLQE